MSLSTEVIKILDDICKRFGIVIDWTSANVIPYLEQLVIKYINYEIATSVIWFISGVMFIIIGIKLANSGKKVYDENGDGDLISLYYAFSLISGVIGASMCLYQTFDIITCLTFPEKILFEEITNLLESIK